MQYDQRFRIVSKLINILKNEVKRISENPEPEDIRFTMVLLVDSNRNTFTEVLSDIKSLSTVTIASYHRNKFFNSDRYISYVVDVKLDGTLYKKDNKFDSSIIPALVGKMKKIDGVVGIRVKQESIEEL